MFGETPYCFGEFSAGRCAEPQAGEFGRKLGSQFSAFLIEIVQTFLNLLSFALQRGEGLLWPAQGLQRQCDWFKERTF